MLDGSFSRDERDHDGDRKRDKKDFKHKRDRKEFDQVPRPSKRPKPTHHEHAEETTSSLRKDRSGGNVDRVEKERNERKQSDAVDEAKRRAGKSMGSLIGRKRKERREKKGK